MRELRAFGQRNMWAAAALLVGVAAVAVAAHRADRTARAERAARTGMVYSSAGFGGYVPAGAQSTHPGPPPRTGEGVNSGAWERTVDAYGRRRFGAASSLAMQVLDETHRAADPAAKHRALQARAIIAYSAAFQKDYSSANEWFADLQQAAAALPDHGKQQGRMGDVLPTWEEEAAFQQVVCLGALGHKMAAEAEYRQFMRRYPDSILIHAAVKRIRRFHQGNLPKDAEAAWKVAMAHQKARDDARRREGAMCGPRCLAELLRRKGAMVTAHALANEAGTDTHGTSLEALAKAASRHGLPLHGVEATEKGLAKLPLPAIALLQPGHYVLVEHIGPTQVSVWDPDGRGPAHPGERSYAAGDWDKTWNGMALVR